MAVRIESQAEPIPGYKLIERLGGGGYGEVWKAEAPGGLLKAIKFVYGDLEAKDNDEDGAARAGQELKALSRVKTVHHPYILSLERYDIVDGQLMIVMELADRTLWDRFRDCRNQGLPGIPRAELLGYMEETAEALDLMNTEYQLQHLDIKPQNLFLVHNHVKVADFGLVKDLEGMSAAVTGGVTPVYAAPETFDGWVSRFSDQYSLAIVYQELLSGVRPFAGTNMRQLILQHMQAKPDLAALPLSDRPVIERGLAKNPDDRFGSCLEMVQALRQAELTCVVPTSLPPVDTARPASQVAPASPATPPVADAGILDEEITQHARGRPGKPKVLEQVPGSPAPVEAEQKPAAVPTPAKPAQQPVTTPAATPATPPPPAAEVGLQPALIIGLGEVGREILRNFRQEIHEQGGSSKTMAHVRFLYIDTDQDAGRLASRGPDEAALQSNEVLVTRLHRPAHYLKPVMGKPPLDPWLNNKVLYRIPRQQEYAGIRPLGRLAFVDNFANVWRRVMAEVQTCIDAIRQRLGQSAEGAAPAPRVYVVASLGGGTGSGMFLDAAFMIRNLFKKLGQPWGEVIGVFLLPGVGRQGAKHPAVANAYAALTELQHFSSADAVYTGLFEATEAGVKYNQVKEKGPPFSRCVLLEFPELIHQAGSDPAQDAAWNKTLSLAGQYLVTELLNPVGNTAADIRSKWLDIANTPTSPQATNFFYQTCGLYRVLWPRQQLLFMWGQCLCRRLVERWMNKDAKPVSDEIRSWVERQWEAHRFRLENLIERYQEGTEKNLRKSPEKLFNDTIRPAIDALTPAQGTDPAAFTANMGPVVSVLAKLEQIVGIPGQTGSEISLVEKALNETATRVAAECDQKMAELIVLLIEDPRYRLAGAEEAIRQLQGLVQQALQNLEQLAKELHDRAVLVHQRMQTLLDAPTQQPVQATSSIWKPFSRRSAAAPTTNPGTELLELLRSYPKCRYQSLILQSVQGLYLSMRGHLSDQIREVGFCRQRLAELSDLLSERSLGPTGKPLVPPPSPAVDLYLFPDNHPNLLSALQQIEERLTPEDDLAFDQRIQPILRRQFDALVQVCLASSSVVRKLATVLQGEAQDFLDSYLKKASVVDMYMAQAQGPDEGTLVQRLRKAFDRAAPPLHGAARGKHLCLISLPGETTNNVFRESLRQVSPEARLISSPRQEELCIYREHFLLVATDLEQLGPLAQETFQQRLLAEPNCLHSREDIPEWRS